VSAVTLPAARKNYRAEFLAAVDAGMALMPKARPQSIAEWRRQMFPGLAAAVSAENAPVSQPGVPSGPASAPPSVGRPRSTSGAKSDAAVAGTLLPPTVTRRPDFHAQPRSTVTSRLTFALGLLLLIGGIVAVIQTQTDLTEPLSRFAGSNSVAGNSTEGARREDLQRKVRQTAEEDKRQAEAERVGREQVAAAARQKAEDERQKQQEEQPKQYAAIDPKSQAETDVSLLVSRDPKLEIPTEVKSHVPTGVGRANYLKKVQTTLKGYNCYSGDINGDLDDARGALERFETSYQGTVWPINLTSATIEDYEDWLSWSEGLEKVSCPSKKRRTVDDQKRPKKVLQTKKPSSKKARQTKKPSSKKLRRTTKKRVNRKKKVRATRKRQPRRQQRRSGSTSTMTGIGF
jgi:hypothetical protein